MSKEMFLPTFLLFGRLLRDSAYLPPAIDYLSVRRIYAGLRLFFLVGVITLGMIYPTYHWPLLSLQGLFATQAIFLALCLACWVSASVLAVAPVNKPHPLTTRALAVYAQQVKAGLVTPVLNVLGFVALITRVYLPLPAAVDYVLVRWLAFVLLLNFCLALVFLGMLVPTYQLGLTLSGALAVPLDVAAVVIACWAPSGIISVPACHQPFLDAAPRYMDTRLFVPYVLLLTYIFLAFLPLWVYYGAYSGVLEFAFLDTCFQPARLKAFLLFSAVSTQLVTLAQIYSYVCRNWGKALRPDRRD
jgi:hypothetical protein